MNTALSCYCGSRQPYKYCCEPYITQQALPNTALALMRSRYTAYATQQIDYIKDTMKGKALDGFNPEESLNWAKQVHFTQLEIVGFTDNTVEFKAYYEYEGKPDLIHENSLFRKIKDRWYYIDKKASMKPKRNAPCPCGSQKKYKQCCGT